MSHISEDELWIDKVRAPVLLSLVTSTNDPEIKAELVKQAIAQLIIIGKYQSKERRDILAGYAWDMRRA